MPSTPLSAPRSAAIAPVGTDGWAVLACLAIAFPTLIAYNVPPSATFLNQAAALVGWGGFLTLLASGMPSGRTAGVGSGLMSLLGAFGLLCAAALVSPLWTGLPWSLSLSSAGMIMAAVLAVLAGATAERAGVGIAAFEAFCIGMVVAGVASSAIGIVQVFFPSLADGTWIAASVFEGRAVGNLRQPNHLSSLLLWGIVAAVWLGDQRVLNRLATALLALLFVFVVVLSASRTGAVGAVMLAVWGGLDRRLSRHARGLLIAMPVAYAAFWLGTAAWAHFSAHVFGGETRFSGQGDVSSSRFGIWSNTLAMIAAHPWLGVGFGEFNFAWSLSPFPHRPVAFFDHTHNLPLQFAVELGLPLAALVLGLMLWALWRAFAGAFLSAPRGEGADRPAGDQRSARTTPNTSHPAASESMPMLRAAFVMVLMVVVHSLLEYPLWYAYFLLPTAFAFGLCLGGATSPSAATLAETPGDGNSTRAATARPGTSRPLFLGAMVLMCAGLLSLVDYLRVVVIFSPLEDSVPLADRIESGRHSVLFAHHAEYAAATTAEHPADTMRSFDSASHYLLDTRLMMAWAKAFDEAGDTERARQIAQRLREFRNSASKAFFDECDAPAKPGGKHNGKLPFQCTPPATAMDYRAFESR
ncbi:hypothetical protein BH11PSE8_BH11PSE8_35620 [soil metagenome]